MGKAEAEAGPDKKSESSLTVVSKSDITALKRQRELLKEFVSGQLVEADFSNPQSSNYGEGDYGIIPGTKKRCLFKQGAEKLQRLFILGCRFKLVDKEIDKSANFALFTYKCEVFQLSTGIVIAECDAAANSQEVKYKERTVWKTKTVGGKKVRESSKEETPIFDVLNTLQKMAQKRAMVGATLLATAASEYFTADLLEPEDLAAAAARTVDEVNNESSEDEAKELPAPECCGQQMIVSKFVDKDFGHAPYYCVKCRSKKPRQ